MPLFFLTVIGFAVFAFRRVEGLGTLLMAVAVALQIWLVFGVALPFTAPFLVTWFGLHALTLTAGIGILGICIRFGTPMWPFESARVLTAVALAIGTTAGLLGFIRPDWSLGGIPLAENSAGGELGTLLTNTVSGLFVWLLLGAGLVKAMYPQMPGSIDAAIQELRSWRANDGMAVRLRSGLVIVEDGLRLEMSLAMRLARWTRGAAQSVVDHRREAVGALLVVVSAVLGVWVVTSDSLIQPVRGLVELLGLGSFGLLLWLAVEGIGRWSNAGWLRDSRKPIAFIVAVLAVAAPLGALRPDLHIGQVALAEVTTGGELGAFLAGSKVGLGLWLALVVGLVVASWPKLMATALRLALRSAWRAAVAVVKIACPIDPAPDEIPDPYEVAPDWMLVDEDDAAEFARHFTRRREPPARVTAGDL
jgi:hypothetical protein